jgi:AraC-like DNA-binding protein
MYAERPSRLPYTIAWRSETPVAGGPVRILPDGCMDLIWSSGRVFVAGPDTTAEVASAPPGTRTFGLRFAVGTGPGVLGLPADEFTDREVPLADLWRPADVRRLAEADDPLRALEDVAARRWRTPDRTMVAVAAQARAGRSVDAIAESCGLGARQLHRRCTTTFGYGPKLLTRVLRLQRALGLARAGTPFAEVAATAGYADQAHLARDVRALAGVPLRTLLTPRAAQPAGLSGANRSTPLPSGSSTTAYR